MLPTSEERKEIFKIHIAKRGRGAMVDSNKLNLDMLASQTKGFSGSEIEEAVIEALYIAFEGDRDLNMVDLGQAISETRPLSLTMKEDFKELEKWCKDRTRPANSPEKDVESMIPVKEGSRAMDA
jgi:SpoVK/Ycf46/Vps4 family AAA+-type ATPase